MLPSISVGGVREAQKEAEMVMTAKRPGLLSWLNHKPVMQQGEFLEKFPSNSAQFLGYRGDKVVWFT